MVWRPVNKGFMIDFPFIYLFIKIFTILYITNDSLNIQSLVTCSSFLLTAAGSCCIYKIIRIHVPYNIHIILSPYRLCQQNSCQLQHLVSSCPSFLAEWQPNTHIHTVIQKPLSGGQVWWQMEQWWVRKAVKWGRRSQTSEIYSLEWPKTWEKGNIKIKFISNWILSLTGLLT